MKFNIKTLRNLRKTHGLTQDQLSEKCKLTQTYIARMESGRIKRPSYETVHAMASALGVKPETFYQRKAAPAPKPFNPKTDMRPNAPRKYQATTVWMNRYEHEAFNNMASKMKMHPSQLIRHLIKERDEEG